MSATPVKAQHVSSLASIRDTHLLPIQRTQGWLRDLFGGSQATESPQSKTLDRDHKSDKTHRLRTSVSRYRTLCVRLCDGYYWPISHSAARNRFTQDATQCERSCPGQSQLFLQPAGGQDVDGMVDLKGVPYSKLSNALRYRKEYMPDCTCRAHPWDAEALARHRAYAEAAKSSSEAPRVETKPPAKSQIRAAVNSRE